MQCAVIVGVGVTMNNMLYIVAGLVIVLLIAVLVMRKNKAQKPSAQPYVKSGRNATTPTPMPRTGGSLQDSVTGETKFDPITIAQRFMDQQRYDKAIETINRGLREKPNDGPLSLKLLSIYATINESENFNKVYDSIKTQNDPKSIALADELKTLFFEEQNQLVEPEAPIDEKTNFESIDFDLPVNKANGTNNLSDSDVISNHAPLSTPTENATFSDDYAQADTTADNSNNDFDLTLSDLEDDLNESDDITLSSATPVTTLDIADDESLSITTNDNTAAVEDTDLSDFDFDFDATTEDSSTVESPVTADTAHNANAEITLEDEDFVLDFDDLATDVDADVASTTSESIYTEQPIDIDNNDDDFTLSFDSLEEADSLDEANDLEMVLESEEPALEELAVEETASETNNDIDNLVLEDIDFEEQSIADSTIEEAPTVASSTAPASPLLFDDNTLIDDDFDFDSLSDASEPVNTAAPVDTETKDITDESTESAEDFSSRFAADFDFVKSLDSNQVTLDLAGQYLQLGEYDSAKRLLNEVMTQGTSEQQSQAQILLDRTA